MNETSQVEPNAGARYRERVLAIWIGTAAAMVIARWFIIHSWPGYTISLPLSDYQDLALTALAAWLSVVLVKFARTAVIQRGLYFASLAVAMLFSVFAAINTVIVHLVRTPLTLKLINLSDHLTGIGASIRHEVYSFRLLKVGFAPIVAVLVAICLCRMAPRMLRRAAEVFARPVTLIVIGAYFAMGFFWTSNSRLYKPALRNPEWAFLLSVIAPDAPAFDVPFPAAYTEDFLPPAQRAEMGYTGAARAVTWNRDPSKRPRNVVLVVLESTGSRHLELYGADVKDTPNLLRLSHQAAVFDRIYAQQPWTSQAMGALFCSLYPIQELGSITNYATHINITGLPRVLETLGYRTAFFHDGQLDFDREGEFLTAHGFALVHSASHDFDGPRDPVLVTQLTKWIERDPSKPFFATLWTQDAHHPYFSDSAIDFDSSNGDLNRYLNSIHEEDQVIGQIYDELNRLGLADDTLLVVTGDHGEDFGEHMYTVHNFTVYEEETRIPLMYINRRLFSTPVRDETLGQQIDIAPTILDLLGIPQPSEWQGTSLFESERLPRAYLVANSEGYEWGLVSRDLKFTFHVNGTLPELYNLTADPLERHNLAGDPRYAAQIAEARQRIAAWYSYQNKFFNQHLEHGSLASSGSQTSRLEGGREGAQ
ncbi:MAG: sulfatase-like hydrolase/transferase [Candidatus Binataceae bacterium]